LLQSITWAPVLLLLGVTAAGAQPQTLRGRSLTLPGNPDEPLPEVHVAANIPTVFLFDAPIERASVHLDTSRLQLVDVSERSLIVMPVVTPGPQEQWVLRVRYADGAHPEWAAFALVSRPPEVDGRIDVVRQAQSLEACQAALAEARAHAESPRPEVWWLAERLGGSAASTLLKGSPPQNDLTVLGGTAYRLATGVLLVFEVANAEGQQPWAPTEATLRSKENQAQVPVRTVAVRPARLEPGEQGQVAVEAELPPPEAGGKFTLELREPSGRSLTLKKVEIPAAPTQGRKDSGP
jgi:uncharacterized protein (TIGR02268 family)